MNSNSFVFGNKLSNVEINMELVGIWIRILLILEICNGFASIFKISSRIQRFYINFLLLFLIVFSISLYFLFFQFFSIFSFFFDSIHELCFAFSFSLYFSFSKFKSWFVSFCGSFYSLLCFWDCLWYSFRCSLFLLLAHCWNIYINMI